MGRLIEVDVDNLRERIRERVGEANATLIQRMNRYRAERDAYRAERDEARAEVARLTVALDDARGAGQAAQGQAQAGQAAQPAVGGCPVLETIERLAWERATR